MAEQQVIHMAPPAERVLHLMADLFGWLASTDAHPLIASSVFHYEFEFIHPFADGNGRMGLIGVRVKLNIMTSSKPEALEKGKCKANKFMLNFYICHIWS
ncbi:MAG: Fic family protein [Desulfobacteraceae bacterium]